MSNYKAPHRIPFFVVQEGIFDPRDETYNFRDWEAFDNLRDAKNCMRRHAVARVIKVECVAERGTARKPE